MIFMTAILKLLRNVRVNSTKKEKITKGKEICNYLPNNNVEK